MLNNVNYNPDVLSCLANLSSDEVFTPPTLANNVLDLLPHEIWSNPDAKFLDPVCKSGVFLREIVKRLNTGLEKLMPKLEERLNHIFTKQVFGIAITELTSLITKRTLYCSKKANGQYSISDGFGENENGNIFYQTLTHTWKGNKCIFCGANKTEYDRENSKESYAYNFIHKDLSEDIFKMKFDVIIGNPPYQMSDGGFGVSAKPIYHKFIQQAKKLNPRYLTMIVPARWYSGGKGLDEFREEMLNDKRLREIHDYLNAADCFGTGVEIKGGVCYFLWDRDNTGLCKVYSHKGNEIVSVSERNSNYDNIFIRNNESISILEKVVALQEKSFSQIVSSRKPFGLPTNFSGSEIKDKSSIELFERGKKTYINKNVIKLNDDWIDKHKILISKAYNAGDNFPHQIINKPFITDPNSCCTETYLVIGPFLTKLESENVISYINTKFFRFLVFLRKNTQDATKKVYSFVPIQDWNESWNDEKLYKKYNLTTEEIEFIESMIKPMGNANE